METKMYVTTEEIKFNANSIWALQTFVNELKECLINRITEPVKYLDFLKILNDLSFTLNLQHASIMVDIEVPTHYSLWQSYPSDKSGTIECHAVAKFLSWHCSEESDDDYEDTTVSSFLQYCSLVATAYNLQTGQMLEEIPDEFLQVWRRGGMIFPSINPFIKPNYFDLPII